MTTATLQGFVSYVKRLQGDKKVRRAKLGTFVRYRAQSVFIKRVMTHAQYDRWNRQGRPL